MRFVYNLHLAFAHWYGCFIWLRHAFSFYSIVKYQISSNISYMHCLHYILKKAFLVCSIFTLISEISTAITSSVNRRNPLQLQWHQRRKEARRRKTSRSRRWPRQLGGAWRWCIAEPCPPWRSCSVTTTGSRSTRPAGWRQPIESAQISSRRRKEIRRYTKASLFGLKLDSVDQLYVVRPYDRVYCEVAGIGDYPKVTVNNNIP